MVVLMCLVVIGMSVFIGVNDSLVGNIENDKSDIIVETNSFKSDEEAIVNILVSWYGDGDFEVVDKRDAMNYVVKSSYVDSEIEVMFVPYKNEIYSDNFIDVYVREKIGVDVLLESVEKLGTQNRSEKLLPYGMKYEIIGVSYDYEALKQGCLPTIESIIKSAHVKTSDQVIIFEKYNAEDLEKFSKNIVEVYKIYEKENMEDSYYSDAMFFTFEDGKNPFNDSENDTFGAYSDSGYIRRGSSIYGVSESTFLLYLNPKPFKIQ